MPSPHLGTGICTRRRLGSSAVLLAAFLAACQPLDLPSFGQSASTGSPAQQDAAQSGAKQQERSEGPSFAEFRDVPIPANADLDFDNLLVLGAEDGWIGRLALTVGYDMPEMYAFYEREMPRFGWLKITSVRAAISTMTYSRGNRIATVTLSSRTVGGTAIDFTVAPTNPLAEKSALQSPLPQAASSDPAS